MKDAYFISLLGAAINDETPQLPPGDIDWKRIYLLANSNSVASAVYYAICKLPDELKPEQDVLALFKKSMQIALGVESMQHYEISELMDSFEKCGIVYVPLKGWFMKKLYPCSYIRTMCDVDILVSKSDMAKISEILSDKGFELEGHIENHDGYLKSGNVAVEIHWNLFNEKSDYFDFFENVLERTYSADGKYGRELSLEDFYLHLIAHLAKHFNGSGAGIRSFADIWLFLKKYNDKLDKAYVNKGLEKLGLDRFEPIVVKTAKQWFGNNSDADFQETSDIIAEYVLDSGTYGNKGIAVASAMEKNRGSRVRYLSGRLFPDKSFLVSQFRILDKMPFLLPFCWIKIGVMILFLKRDRMKLEFDILKNTNAENISDMAKIKKMCGLDKRD